MSSGVMCEVVTWLLEFSSEIQTLARVVSFFMDGIVVGTVAGSRFSVIDSLERTDGAVSKEKKSLIKSIQQIFFFISMVREGN